MNLSDQQFISCPDSLERAHPRELRIACHRSSVAGAWDDDLHIRTNKGGFYETALNEQI